MAADDLTPPPAPEWLPPATLSYGGPYGGGYQPATAAPPSAAFELRPLSLSEVLDRTFALYRSRFWLFAGIAVFSGAFQAIVGIGSLLTQGRMLRQAGATIGQPPSAITPFHIGTTEIIGIVITLVGSLLFFLAYSVTTAASVWAVSEVYLGRVATVKDSFSATIRRWYRYIGIAVWQAFSFAWLPTASVVAAMLLITTRNSALVVLGGILAFVGMIGGAIGGYILYLRNMLAVPACVTERLTVRQSMRRSKVLSSGGKVRIFVMQLIMIGLYMVVGMVQAPFSLLSFFTMAKLHGITPYIMQGITVVISFMGHTLVTPILAIGLTLLYFDARVRKEAFDIAVLMGEEQLGIMDTAPQAPAYPARPPVPSYPVTPASFTGVAEPITPVANPEEPEEAQAGHAPLA